MNRKYVNIYRISRVMMGPEEGGWFADYGTPVGSIPIEFTESEWDEVHEAAIKNGALVYDSGDDTYRPAFDINTHEHNEWCQPDEHDIVYLGEDVPTISARCHEAKWRDHLEDSLREKAQAEAEVWRERYPHSGKRSTVHGGEDFDVVIEDKMAEPFPKETPRYE